MAISSVATRVWQYIELREREVAANFSKSLSLVSHALLASLLGLEILPIFSLLRLSYFSNQCLFSIFCSLLFFTAKIRTAQTGVFSIFILSREIYD